MLDETLQQFCQPGWAREQRLAGTGWQAIVSLDSVNERLKVLSYQAEDITPLLESCRRLAQKRHLGKIMVNVSASNHTIQRQLESADFLLEGAIPGYFSGQEAKCFAHFTDRSRAFAPHWQQEEQIISEVMGNQAPGKSEEALPPGYDLRPPQESDANRLASLYARVFASYPSPLFQGEYIRRVMHEHVYFLAVFHGTDLVSAGSAEMDEENANAEITDLATNPTARGLGLATTIISALEREMWQRQFTCLYSLARAGNIGVNRGLFKLGYAYHGRMINNCHIGGRFEDMNIWVKQACLQRGGDSRLPPR